MIKKRAQKEMLVASLRCYPSIYLDGLRRTINKFKTPVLAAEV
jgi:hypothetical protein